MKFLSFLNPRRPFRALADIAHLVRRHRVLVWELAKREIRERYAGQALGSLWAVAHPLITVAVYIAVFNTIFRVRVGGTPDLPFDYTTFLLSGLVPWLAFTDAMGRAPLVVRGSAGLVKQIVFPVEILPVKAILAGLLTQLIMTVLFLAYVLVVHGFVLPTYAFLPFLMVAQFLFMLGLCWLVSAIGVFFRDIREIITVCLNIGLFVSPVLYNESTVPAAFKALMLANPMTPFILAAHDALFFGRITHAWAWSAVCLYTLAALLGGWASFRLLRPRFGDVL